MSALEIAALASELLACYKEGERQLKGKSMINTIFLLAVIAVNAAPAKKVVPFVVEDLPREPPIEGLLGEPGSPPLETERKKMAQAFLNRGICDVSYFGEEGCRNRHAAAIKHFDITDVKSKLIRDRDATGAFRE